MALIDNIVSYWKFDTNSSTQTDSAGTNNMSVVGATSVTGKIGNGLNFDNDYTSVNNMDYSVGTLNLWIKLNQNGIAQNIFNKHANNDNDHQFSILSTNELSFMHRDGTGSTGDAYYRLIASTQLTTGTWTMITLTADGVANKMYVNGIEETLTVSYGNNTGRFLQGFIGTNNVFGRSARGGTNTLRADLDEIGIWDAPLSGAEILELYNSGNGNQYPFSTTPTGDVANAIFFGMNF